MQPADLRDKSPRYRSGMGKKGAAARGSKGHPNNPFATGAQGDTTAPSKRKIPQKKPYRTYSNNTSLEKAAQRRVASNRAPTKAVSPKRGVYKITTAKAATRVGSKFIPGIGTALLAADAAYSGGKYLKGKGDRDRASGKTYSGKSGSSSGYPASKYVRNSKPSSPSKYKDSSVTGGAYATSSGKSRNLRMGMIAGQSKPGSYTTYNKERPGFPTTKSNPRAKIYTAKRGDTFTKVAAKSNRGKSSITKSNPWLTGKTKARGGNPIYGNSKVFIPKKSR